MLVIVLLAITEILTQLIACLLYIFIECNIMKQLKELVKSICINTDRAQNRTHSERNNLGDDINSTEEIAGASYCEK